MKTIFLLIAVAAAAFGQCRPQFDPLQQKVICTISTANASSINGVSLAGLATGILKNTTGTGAPSIAQSGVDYAPATSGTGLLSANGSGGFLAATFANVVATFSGGAGCSGTNALVANGTCQALGGSGNTPAYNSVAFSATPAFTVTSGSNIQVFKITLTGNVTSSTLVTTGATAGQEIDFIICQDATGSRTWTAPSNTVNFGSVDPTASACSKQKFNWDGSNAISITPMESDNTTPGIVTSNGILGLVTAPDTLMGLAATQTATNKTFTSPKITVILDGNGNPFIQSTAVASAVDALTVVPAATANPATVSLNPTGSDANINLNLTSKGSGTVQCNSVPCGTALLQNSQSAAYTTVLSDAGKQIYHPSADTTARTWTIDSNANVAYPIGTAITFVNDTSAGVITIAITSDTLVLAGSGTTGSRTLAAGGIATALKVGTTRWIINGTGLS